MFENDAVPPTCKAGQQTTYYVARKELVQVPCELEAYPNVNMSFHWSFNDSREVPGANYAIDKLRSTLSYQPVNEEVMSAC